MDLKQQTLRQILDNQAVGFQARFDSFDISTITDDQRKTRKNAQQHVTIRKTCKSGAFEPIWGFHGAFKPAGPAHKQVKIRKNA